MLHIRHHHRGHFFILLCCLGILFGGCQQKPEPPPLAEPQPQLSTTNDIDRDTSCSYFYFLWGRHAELLLHFDEALDAYEKALICDPQAGFINEKLPVLLLRLERTDEAEAWLKEYLVRHGENTGMRMLYAKVLIRQKKNELAMQQYQQILAQHPDDPAILLLLAEMYLAGKQLDKARPILERVLTADSSSYPGHILTARLLQQDGKPDLAVPHYRKALEKNWSSELQMELGELFIKTEQYSQAASLYKEIIEREGHNESARIALVHVYLLQKKDAQALEELNNLKTFVEQPQRVDLTIARLYAKQKHFDKAMAITEQILARENLPEARFFLAVLLTQARKYEKALKQIRQIGRNEEEFAEAFSLQIKILRELKRLDEAIGLLEENAAIDDQARSGEMFIMLAALYQQQGRDDLSRKALQRGLEAYPDDEDLLYEYGLVLENSGEHSAALDVMQRIVELKPDNAAALNFVGYSWADKKVHLEKALDYIQRALALKPDNGYIRDSLGWVYFRLGKIELATKELEAAVKLSPDDPAILEHLADVYLEGGQVHKALETYRKSARKFSGSEKDRKRVLEKISIIEKQGTR